MLSGLFQTLLVPTRTAEEQDADAATANGSPAATAPAPAESAVTSLPGEAGQLPLPAPAGNGAVTADVAAKPNPIAPAATALAAIVVGVGLVLAYPGHHHRARPNKTAGPAAAAPVTVTGPARGAFTPLASAALLTLDPSQVKAAPATPAPVSKTPPHKPAAHARAATPSTGTSPGTSSTPAPSATPKPAPSNKTSGSTKPAPLTSSPKWSSVKGNTATLTFSFARSGGKGTVDQIKLRVSSGTSTPVVITNYDVGKLSKDCVITSSSKNGPNDMLRCPTSLRVGRKYSLIVYTNPPEQGDIAFLGRLYGRIGGKTYGPFETP
jgi:hypothetical protein